MLVSAIDRLRHDSVSGESANLAAGCQDQLTWLYALQGSVSAADSSQLAAMAASVTESVAVSLSAAQQAATAAKLPEATSSQLEVARAAVRDEVQSLQSDLFDRRIFDPYLRFRSPEDEREYRDREAANRRYIEQQFAAGTPEGDLNAAGGTMGQMLDAHSHGAGASPEFKRRWTRLEENTRKLRDAVQSEGRSTDEFDRNLTVSVRRYLRERGLSDAEIEAKLAVSASPLDAVKPYLQTEKDAQQLMESSNLAGRLLPAAETVVATAMKTTSLPLNTTDPGTTAPEAPGVDEVMAKFKAAGVLPATQSEGYDHGVDSAKAKDRSSPTPLP